MITCQCLIQYLACYFHKIPAFLTYFCSFTTCSCIIIISHININYKFFFYCLATICFTWLNIMLRSWIYYLIKNCPNIIFVNFRANQMLLHTYCILKWFISLIDIHLFRNVQFKWKFSSLYVRKFLLKMLFFLKIIWFIR